MLLVPTSMQPPAWRHRQSPTSIIRPRLILNQTLSTLGPRQGSPMPSLKFLTPVRFPQYQRIWSRHLRMLHTLPFWNPWMMRHGPYFGTQMPRVMNQEAKLVWLQVSILSPFKGIRIVHSAQIYILDKRSFILVLGITDGVDHHRILQLGDRRDRSTFTLIPARRTQHQDYFIIICSRETVERG